MSSCRLNPWEIQSDNPAYNIQPRFYTGLNIVLRCLFTEFGFFLSSFELSDLWSPINLTSAIPPLQKKAIFAPLIKI
jgi:hypothetical protein